MLLIMIRTIILYLAVLFSLRVMGKSELSEMEPFQLVILFMLAELAAMPMENPGLSLLNGVAAILCLMFLQVLLSFLSYHSERFRAFFNGKSKILINKGVINEAALKSMRISVSDLLEQLRLKNCPSISDVEYAILETNGELSVIPKASQKTVTRADLNLDAAEESMPAPLIINGHLYNEMLTRSHISENRLKNEMSLAGLSSYKEVLLAHVDEHGRILIYKKQSG